ncbi:hypothetical protein SAMN05216553_102208 [Lentzea fradiae]|uniref:Uncharacterized protein n=1 Tax=Lentzea fradiae TaxID=200378 RepID=A0A1G7MC53_9PSEU|nr:hypothetical protein [Lentzea fradiae]SDF59184.1 hypothetical protein SAMN05216553_102208 [Lentzea fradiae]
MFTRKSLLIPMLVSAGLLVVLGVVGWSLSSDPVSSAPPSGSQNTSVTQSVSIVPTPDLAEISVKTSTTTTTTTTTTRVTQPDNPQPVQSAPPEQQPPTTTEPPQRGLLVIENASCNPEGATGIGLRDEQLVCRKDPQRGDRLRWQKP